MATVVQSFGISDQKLEFSGSSDEDINYAKTFWQSVQLLPPMESRLVSKDINQRLKAAPPGHQPINLTYPQREEDPPVLKKFLQRAKAEENYAQRRKLDRLANFRAHDRALLQKHREIRKKKEAVSNHIGLAPPPSPPPPIPSDTIDHTHESEVNIDQTVYNEIAQFEQAKGLPQTLCEDGELSDS